MCYLANEALGFPVLIQCSGDWVGGREEYKCFWDVRYRSGFGFRFGMFSWTALF